MDVVGIANLRSQLGRSLRDWVSSPEMAFEVSGSSWYLLTGLPMAGANVALVHQGDARAFDELIGRVGMMGVPACIYFAADARDLSTGLNGSWRFSGTTPFMSLNLDDVDLKIDPRVRLASEDDFEALTDLMTETYGMDYDSASQGASPLKNPDGGSDVWIIEEDGRLISTAITRRVDDSITLWNMATSPRFERRGYGKAVMNHALHQARQDGAKVGLLVSSDAGKPLYDATGWVTIEDWDVYLKVTVVSDSE